MPDPQSQDTAALERPLAAGAETSTGTPLAAVTPSLSPTVGRYVLRDEIARGGMGVVYRATDTTLDREVAVKVLGERFDATSGVGRRFVEEARITGQLQHPGIPAVHDLGTLPDGRPFLAMKLIRGHTLADLLKQRASPAQERGRFVAIFEAICQALGYAHAHGVIHRDLKPANVMVGAFGEVQVMDWGLAKVLASKEDPTAGEETSVATEIRTQRDSDGLETQAGSVLGTPAYMPPEQAIGAVDRIDARSDVFGLGGILLVILTGRRPFVANNAEATRQLAARAELDEAFAALDACGAEPELVALCKRCLSPKQDDRPADAGAVARAVAALRAAADDRARQAELERVQAQAEAREQRKRRRVQLALVVTVGLLLLGVGTVAWWQQRQEAARLLRAAADHQAAQLTLDQAETALQRDNPIYGEIDAALTQADQRIQGGGADDLRDRLATAQAARRLLERLDRSADRRWTADEEKRRLNAEGARAAYAEALREAGFDLEGDTPEGLAGRVRESLLAGRLTAALDEWLEVGGPPRLVAVLAVLDPDPERRAIRAAIARRDGAALKGLVGKLAGQPLPPSFAVLIGMTNLIPQEERLPHVRRAQQAHPAHFGLAMATSLALPESEVEERVAFLRVAVALRPGAPVPHYNLGVALRTKKDVDGAIAECREAIRLDPKHDAAHNNLGACLSEKGDVDGAIVEYRQAIRLNPKHASAHFNLGEALRAKKDVDGAIVEYQKAIRLNPKYARAHTGLGNALRAKKDVEGAIVEYQKAIRLDPKDVFGHTGLGHALLDKKDVEGAIAAFREAIRLDPKDVLGHNNLGYALLDKKDVDGAIAAFREALRIDPKFVFGHNGLGTALRDKKDVEGAIAEFKEALRIDPKFALAHYNLGLALCDKVDMDGAIAEFKEAIRLDPKYAYAHNGLGVALRNKGDLDAAIAECREAIRLDPKHAPAHNNLGYALLDKKDVDGAIAAFREAIRLDPKYVHAHYNLGNALYAKKDVDGAIVEYQEAIRLDPKAAPAHNNLGAALRNKKDVDGAIVECREAIRLDPKDASFHNNLGNALRDKKDVEGAIAEFREAIRLDPKAAPAHYNLGNALYAKKDVDGAIAAFREAIRLDPKAAPAHNILGLALCDKVDMDGAIAEFKEAIRLDPKYAYARNNLGVTLLNKKDVDGAIVECREAIRLDPKDASFHNNLGNALLDKKDVEGAIAEFKEALRIDPKYAFAHYDLGAALLAKKDVDGAIVECREAIRLDPKYAYAHNGLGVALRNKGDLDAAIAEFKEAIFLNPRFALAHNNLGWTLQQKGDLDGAIAAFKEAIRIDPRYADALANLTRTERTRELLSRLSGVLAGKAEPKTPAETCAFANLCAQPFQKKYAAAVRLFEKAFAVDPKLADVLAASYRYDAACDAALAAAGQGDGAALKAPEQLTLRGKALVWLRADLALWQKQASSVAPTDRKKVVTALSWWLKDSDLASTRPGVQRDGWSKEEVAAWDALWADVRAALADANK